jgi:[ribosomal protein S18]-alanine N-acetyltransferase
MPVYHIIRSASECIESIRLHLIAEFLYTHLDEYRDDLDAIKLAIDHALGETGVRGGFLLVATEGDSIIGALVMNRTGMSQYIPENILVYIAVHRDYRNRGIGGEMLLRALDLAEGDIKLHVEYTNPAKRAYERIGFTTKYAEMRYYKRR